MKVTAAFVSGSLQRVQLLIYLVSGFLLFCLPLHAAAKFVGLENLHISRPVCIDLRHERNAADLLSLDIIESEDWLRFSSD